MYTYITAFLLVASALASPRPVALPQEADPPASPTPPESSPRCKVNMAYVDDWWELASPGSRWRYRVTWSDNTTALSTTPLGDVLLAMGTVGCCALVDNPQAWLDGTESILLDFGEVAKPVGYDKAKCQNTNIQRELATRWKCDVGSGDNSDVKCA